MLFVFGGAISGCALLYGRFALGPRVDAFQHAIDFSTAARDSVPAGTFGYIYDIAKSDAPLVFNDKQFALLREQTYERLQQKHLDMKQKSSYSNELNLIIDLVKMHEAKLMVGGFDCSTLISLFQEQLLEETFEPTVSSNASQVVNVNQNSGGWGWGRNDPAPSGEQERVITGHIKKKFGVPVNNTHKVCVFGSLQSGAIVSHSYNFVSHDPPSVVIQNETQFANSWNKFWAIAGGISVAGFAITKTIRNSQ